MSRLLDRVTDINKRKVVANSMIDVTLTSHEMYIFGRKLNM